MRTRLGLAEEPMMLVPEEFYDREKEQLDLEKMADELVQRFVKSPEFIVAYSFGALLTLEMLRLGLVQPERVFLLSAIYDGGYSRALQRNVMKWLDKPHHAKIKAWCMRHPRLFFNDFTKYLSYPNLLWGRAKAAELYNMHFTVEKFKYWYNGLRAMNAADYKAFLAAGDHPPIVTMWGDSDNTIMEKYYRGWEQFPNVESVRMPGVDHHPLHTHPDEVAEIIKRYI